MLQRTRTNAAVSETRGTSPARRSRETRGKWRVARDGTDRWERMRRVTRGVPKIGRADTAVMLAMSAAQLRFQPMHLLTVYTPTNKVP